MAPKEGNGTTNCVNSLLDLLTVVSLDTVDNSLLDREAERCVIELRQSRDSLPDDPQAWDRQVEKLIRQLRESVRETPERDIDLLKDPDMRLHYSSPDPEPEYKPQMPPAQRDDPDASEDRRQYLEREFSSTSYPKIGPGYSDSISVVSDVSIHMYAYLVLYSYLYVHMHMQLHIYSLVDYALIPYFFELNFPTLTSYSL